jgi:phosphoenolpyruvate synthase/pyruvate phosphate dikinase
VTNDKREKVVFDSKRGQGTIRVESLYHERFRPALEYVELCELVGVASRLESIYGCPLDIEFAYEGTRLAILQVRPVATFAAVLRETRDRYPVGDPGGTEG